MKGPTLEGLYALFTETGPSPGYQVVCGEDVPEPYRGLLVHEHHMTVTVEAFHGGPVDVRVLERRTDGDLYARKILLVLQSSGRVVQFGIVRIDLSQTSAEVAEAIRSESTPLGRILIEHNVLRRIEPTAYLRLDASAELLSWFGIKGPTTLYGRLAIIHCDEKPAVELLEVVAPE